MAQRHSGTASGPLCRTHGELHEERERGPTKEPSRNSGGSGLALALATRLCGHGPCYLARRGAAWRGDEASKGGGWRWLAGEGSHPASPLSRNIDLFIKISTLFDVVPPRRATAGVHFLLTYFPPPSLCVLFLRSRRGIGPWGPVVPFREFRSVDVKANRDENMKQKQNYIRYKTRLFWKFSGKKSGLRTL